MWNLKVEQMQFQDVYSAARLCWEPETTLREGLVKTIAYFDDVLLKNGKDTQ